MEIVHIKVDALIPYARNARTHSDAQIAQIAASIKEFGFNNPVLLRDDNTIVAGHGRILAARKLGLDAVPCVYLSHLSEAQARAYVLADNQLALKAGWDEDMLRLELADLRDEGFDPALLGFDPIDLRGLGAGEGGDGGADAEPQIGRKDELQEKWGVVEGQIWRLGEHRLACGDSTDAGVIALLLEGERASLVFTDPPYGVAIAKKNQLLHDKAGRRGSNKTAIQDDELGPDDLKARLLPAFQNIRQHVMSDDCTVFVTAPQGGDLGMMMLVMMREAGLPVRHVLIWKKDGPTFSMGRLDYDYQHEPILLTWGKRHKRPMLGGHRTSVWEIPKPRSSKDHPTMKPVELVVNALLNNSDQGDLVFDAYHGSGTTLIACEQTGRRCRAVEIDPGYVAVAIERWAESTGGAPQLAG